MLDPVPASSFLPRMKRQACQVDEHCDINDLLRSTEVLALTLIELAGAR